MLHYMGGGGPVCQRGGPLSRTRAHPVLHRVTPLVEESVKERPSEQDGSSPDDLANLVPLCHSSVTAPTV